MAAWGGAQWLLAFWLALEVLLPMAVRIAGYSTRPANEWLGFWIGKLIDACALILILTWGGFWA